VVGSLEEVLQPFKDARLHREHALGPYWRAAWLCWEKVGHAIVKVRRLCLSARVGLGRSLCLPAQPSAYCTRTD
jgi:hypothetical protein